MRYGYKIFGLSITPVRQPGDPVTLDDSVFGPGGAREMIGRHLVASVEGKADEVRQLFTRVDVVQAEGWGLLLTVSGGPFGQSAEVVDLEQGRPRNPVVATDAVLSPGRVLFVVPPTGTHGVLVSEVRGRSHHGRGA